jgi:hydroxymethylbilane synthase
MSSRPVIIVTRGSPLALQQANDAAARLGAALSRPTEIRILTTTGDRQAAWSLEKQGGKGLFTAELEQALLRGEADVAVHSSKDLPTEMPAGLAIAVCLPRQDARDVLVRRTEIATPALIATGSPRRRAQGARTFPGARWTELRGNVDTRLKKLANGDADASYLAASGLNRLAIREWPGLAFEPVPIASMVPAAGQGAVAIQTRADDIAAYAAAGCARTTFSVFVERLFLSKLGEGCHTAFACHHADGHIHLFREDFGRHEFDFPATDLAAASELADRILRQILPSRP